jgi:hypothetical protein
MVTVGVKEIEVLSVESELVPDLYVPKYAELGVDPRNENKLEA